MNDVLFGLGNDDYGNSDYGNGNGNGSTASRRGSYTMSDELMGGGSSSKRTSYTMSEDSGERTSRRPSYTMHLHSSQLSPQISEAQSHLENDFPGYESHMKGTGAGTGQSYNYSNWVDKENKIK